MTIVANVLFGGILGCLGWANASLAVPTTKQLSRSPSKSNRVLSTNLKPGLATEPQQLKVDRVFRIERQTKSPVHLRPIEWDRDKTKVPAGDRWSQPATFSDRSVTFGKLPYIHQTQEIDLVLGFQNTFWSGTSDRQYWGITAVEHWGKSDRLQLSKLNYTESAPILATGSSSLTFSGGGNRNLTPKSTLARDKYKSSEFEEFRGGITYHHGIASQVVLGVGFVYENSLAGFTQLTYDSDILPVTTTVSLLAKDSTLDLHSHVKFQPTPNFAIDYYHDREKQKFDLNWEVAPDLTFVGKGNSKNESYSAGIKVAIREDYLSLTTTAELDNQSNLQWKINSQIGGFQLVYSSTQRERSLELDAKMFDLPELGLQCFNFVEYQSKFKKAQDEFEDFIVWGGKLQSARKIDRHRHLWSWDLGYGSGVHGRGVLINGSVALKPNLFLKLKYQTISATSDDTEVKLELSSD